MTELLLDVRQRGPIIGAMFRIAVPILVRSHTFGGAVNRPAAHAGPGQCQKKRAARWMFSGSSLEQALPRVLLVHVKHFAGCRGNRNHAAFAALTVVDLNRAFLDGQIEEVNPATLLAPHAGSIEKLYDRPIPEIGRASCRERG